MARFITLAGRKQVGKDTSANMIKDIICPPWTCEQVQADIDGYTEHEKLEESIHLVHFADSLKDACVSIFGIDRDDMETEEGKQRATQILWPNDVSADYADQGGAPPLSAWHPHVDVMQEGLGRRYMTVREILQFVGTELFRNQMDPNIWVQSVYRRSYGEQDVVIVADCRFPNEAKFGGEHGLLLSIERETGLAGDSHASETALDGYDAYHHVLQNNGSFEDLKAQLRVVLETEGFLS